MSLGVARGISDEDAARLDEPSIGDGDKTWGFCTQNGGIAATVRMEAGSPIECVAAQWSKLKQRSRRLLEESGKAVEIPSPMFSCQVARTCAP